MYLWDPGPLLWASLSLAVFAFFLIQDPDLLTELYLVTRQIQIWFRRKLWLLRNHPDLPWVKLMIHWRAHRIADELLKEAERKRQERDN